ncbi:hypothetical protein N9937_00215 [bacterium]|nr:hypothetical protein [bacterium]
MLEAAATFLGLCAMWGIMVAYWRKDKDLKLATYTLCVKGHGDINNLPYNTLQVLVKYLDSEGTEYSIINESDIKHGTS